MNNFYVLGKKKAQQMASANFYFLENLEDKYQGPVNYFENQTQQVTTFPENSIYLLERKKVMPSSPWPPY